MVGGETDVLTVHPHACGENSVNKMRFTGLSGSPPRLWGKRGTGANGQRHQRFTPTPVGKTWSSSGIGYSLPVHPHACGENSHAFETIRHRLGSPPRLWGKRYRPYDCRGQFHGSPPRLWGKTVTAVSGVRS